MYRIHNSTLSANRKRRAFSRQQLVTINKMRRKIDCPSSEVYNNHHNSIFGNGCGYKHLLYSWEGRIDNQATLISDSMCKWVNKLPHTHVQAIPGLSLISTLDHLRKGTLQIRYCNVIILHVGTNCVWSDTPEAFKHQLEEIIDYIRRNSNVKRIGLSSILPRPRDITHPDIEIKRRQLNTVMCKLCAKQINMLYMRSWKAVTILNQTDQKCYARDRIHLNFEGIIRMRRYMRGASANLLDLCRPRAQPSTMNS